MTLRLAFFTLALVAAAGCASETSAPAPSTGIDPNAPYDPSQPCSTLENVAKPVEMVDEAAEPPPAKGGVLSDGTYVVTRAVRYTRAGGAAGPTQVNVRMTVRITGSVAESNFDDGPRRARIAVDGTMLRSTNVCPSASAAEDVPFSAGLDGLTLYLNDKRGTRVYSLTRI
ncbi:MAG: hypothetical protein JST00_45155 [Deltaproteobacteria bacterium]|nr:hypothetical protein [Deltaproteobacteria bacterium]